MTASPQKASAAAGPLPHHPRSGKKSSSEMPVQKCQTLSPSAEELSATKIQTTAERFSSTTTLSRLSGLRSPRNLRGGPGRLQHLVRRAWGIHLSRGMPAQPVDVVCRQDNRRLPNGERLDRAERGQ